jgi:DNA-binding SARP family transcriptional activator
MPSFTLHDRGVTAAMSSQIDACSGAIGLALLGRFRLMLADHEVTVPESAQRLLVLLALRGRPQTRMFLAGSLWPEKSDDRAAANLRSSLWRARLPGGQPLVVTSGSLVGLSSAVSLDIGEMEAAGWKLLAGSDAALPETRVRSLFFEELLPGWYDDWVILERERIGQIQRHFLEGLVDNLLEAQRYAEALDTALRLKAIDPGRERSQRVLIRVYEAEGSTLQAQRCRRECSVF